MVELVLPKHRAGVRFPHSAQRLLFVRMEGIEGVEYMNERERREYETHTGSVRTDPHSAHEPGHC